MDRGTPFVVAAMLAAGLAGCTGAGTGTAQSSIAPPATATADTGGIEGLVVNDEQIPIQGANVTLKMDAGGMKQNVVTLDGGAYSFSGLDPGAYTLNVSAFGYEPATGKAQVLAGVVTRVTTTLREVYIAEPMPIMTPKRGFINCSTSTPANQGGFYSYNWCRNGPNEASQILLPLDRRMNATEVILELVWQPGTAGTGQVLQMWLCSDKDDNTNYGNCLQLVGSNPYAVRTQGASPLVMRRQDLPFKTVQNFEIDVGDGFFEGTNARPPVTFQQNFDLYITVCYVALCTAEYKGRP